MSDITASSGGSGGRTDRTESGRTELQDSRLTAMAIRRGWLKGQRWATDATVTDLMKVQQERDLTLRERTVLAVMTDIAGKDPRVRQIAVKSAVVMESQNQADEHALIPKEGTTVNVAVVNNEVQVKVDDDWYGNRDRIAQIAAGHGADAAGSSAQSDP